jgi:hypothetical protein
MTNELALILSTAFFFTVMLSLAMGLPLYKFAKMDKEREGK